MGEYFSQSAYMRWLRNYNVTATHYLDFMYSIRERLLNLPDEFILKYNEDAKKIEDSLDLIESKLEDANPRDFSRQAEPLRGTELFVEDMKVLVNLAYSALKKPAPFDGIYEEERKRIQKLHEDFRFKEKLAEVKMELDKLLKKYIEEQQAMAEQQAVAEHAVNR